MARRKGKPVHGWLIFDKPRGMSSTQAVGKLKRIFQAQKAGHAGTLDPLATGVLPIAFGEATKTVSYLMDARKGYQFTVRWGVETDTDDCDGSIVAESEKRPEKQEIVALIPEFTGEILQVPPQFSAVRIKGERAYDLARDGQDFELKPRPALIDHLEIVECTGNDSCTFETECGKGTYVRALARDMGRELGCFGHVTDLRRTKVGPFLESRSISLVKLEKLSHSAAGCDELLQVLEPVEAALDDIPALAISSSDAARLKRGQTVILRGRDSPILKGPVYAMSRGTLVALGEVKHGELHPSRVFNLPV